MQKLVLATLLIATLLALGEGRKIYYYPDPDDPNAIVFEGPTNKDETKEITDNEVIDPDYSKLIDIRIQDEKDSECPKGFVSYGGICFPND